MATQLLLAGGGLQRAAGTLLASATPLLLTPLPAPGLDPHAYAAFVRGGLVLQKMYWAGTPYEITGEALLKASSDWCTTMKTSTVDGKILWDLLHFRYMFQGDTPAAVLCNVRVQDGSRDGILQAGAHFDIAGNGAKLVLEPSYVYGQGYIKTGYRPAAEWGVGNALSIYLTELDVASPQVFIGASQASAGPAYFDLVRVDGTLYFENSSGGMMSAPVPSFLGRLTGTRTADYATALYRNATLLALDTSHPNAGYPSPDLGIGDRSGDTGSYISLSRYAAADAWDGLTSNQEAAIYQAEVVYQTALKRNI